MKPKPETIDAYFEGVSPEQRAALEKLRQTIKRVVPEAEECITYGIAGFKLHGKSLVAFGATRNHCAFYPMNDSIVEDLQHELKSFETSKGTVRFQPDKPIPARLVGQMVNSRRAEIERSKPRAKPSVKRATKKSPKTTSDATDVEKVLVKLNKLASIKTRDGMSRFGIPSDHAIGVSVGDLKKLAKEIGRNHELALSLWEIGIYEARMLATFVDDPDQVSAEQMERWCRSFDSWAICDTACFHLFDRTPHAWKKVKEWSKRKEEFVKRAGFALLASLVAHDKSADDELFADALPLIEKASTDERNFVKKGVNWALRCIGKRSPSLRGAAITLSQRLANSDHPAARWIGKDALRDLGSAKLEARLAKKSQAKAKISKRSTKR